MGDIELPKSLWEWEITGDDAFKVDVDLSSKLELLGYAGGVLALMECLLQLQFRWLTAPIASICARAICRPALGLFQVEHPGPSRVARGNKDHSVMCQLRDCCQPAAQILKVYQNPNLFLFTNFELNGFSQVQTNVKLLSRKLRRWQCMDINFLLKRDSLFLIK